LAAPSDDGMLPVDETNRAHRDTVAGLAGPRRPPAATRPRPCLPQER
jgi:hypothetical protein